MYERVVTDVNSTRQPFNTWFVENNIHQCTIEVTTRSSLSTQPNKDRELAVIAGNVAKVTGR